MGRPHRPLPPIKPRRLYSNPQKTGPFVLEAVPLPAQTLARMTDAEVMKRMDEECAAIEAEWKKIREGPS